MRTKVLITGSQDTIIDDFFTHTEEAFQCMSSSIRINDLYTHVQYFEPEVFVYCLGKNKDLDAEVIAAAKDCMKYTETMLALIGEKESLAALPAEIINSADVPLTKPISIKKIQVSIERELEEIRLEAERKEREKLEAERRKIEQAKHAEREAQKAARAAEPKHILVIDDDPVMLRTVKHYLEEDYNVATAPSGKIAMKFLEQRKTDIILLDYEMPVCNGPQMLEMLRADPEMNSIPVFFLTGKGDRASIEKVLALKPQGYLLKTLPKEKILEALQQFFNSQEEKKEA